jgi:hypothetical protein
LQAIAEQSGTTILTKFNEKISFRLSRVHFRKITASAIAMFLAHAIGLAKYNTVDKSMQNTVENQKYSDLI